MLEVNILVPWDQNSTVLTFFCVFELLVCLSKMNIVQPAGVQPAGLQPASLLGIPNSQLFTAVNNH